MRAPLEYWLEVLCYFIVPPLIVSALCLFLWAVSSLPDKEEKKKEPREPDLF